MNILFLQFLLGILFLTVIFLHLAKKNFTAAIAYGIQSLMICIIFLNSFFETGNIYIYIVVLFTLVIKVILAPLFFIRLIKKHALSFSVSTYLNTPLTLIIIAVLTFIAHSQKFVPLTSIFPAHQALLSLALSSIFLSLFLIINRKGVISQILGILSLENSIVAFIVFAGLEQSPGLQIGVIFNLFVWIVITTVFASMIYEHFGSHDVTSMKNLTD
jgi:hydrogenase-4 membrane subunit HyfE